MPIVQVYRSGSTSGNPPPGSRHDRAKRSEVIGWSAKAARNQRAWFYGINIEGLTGLGVAFTFTLRDCPPSAAALHAVRRALVKRFQRMGALRIHWLVEWQRRGVPHLHGCVYFPDDVSQEVPLGPAMVDHWLQVAAEWGPLRHCQHVAPILTACGWLKYLAKHGARGAAHYQRANCNIPAGWRKTGRMWGYLGAWPVEESMRFEMGMEAMHRFRRIVRSWAVSEARAPSSSRGRQVAYARRMLKCWDRGLSTVRGTSEWMPIDVTTACIVFLGSSGYEVRQVFEKSGPLQDGTPAATLTKEPT